MRRWIAAVAALAALAACNKKQETQDVSQVDQALASDNLTSNDLTAIDAVTGADANMAADIPADAIGNDSDESNASANAAKGRKSTESPAKPKADEPAAPPAEAPAPANSDSGEGEI